MCDALLDLIDQSSVQVVIPVHDGTIEAVTQRRKAFEHVCAVALAPPAALDAAIDKDQTLRIASDLGLRVPRSVARPRRRRRVARQSPKSGSPRW